jgi:PAS domain S-box-containing protein
VGTVAKYIDTRYVRYEQQRSPAERYEYRARVALEPFGGSTPRRPALRWAVGVAISIIVVVVAVDIAIGNAVVLAPAVLAAPFLVAVSASGRTTALVGLLATAGATASIALQDLSAGQRAADIAVVVIGSLGATIVAAERERGDAELTKVRPEIDVARRLQLALDAGRMGTWSWDIANNVVHWDDSLSMLFGMQPGTFEKTFDAWVAHLHPDDRARALATVEEAVATGGQFRFDHRTIWPDGTVHWIEGRGEAVFDEHGTVIGAIGVSIDIDERRRTDLERMTLLTSERRARSSAERSMAALARLQEVTFGLSGATTVDEIGHLILERGMAALGAVSGYFATLDTDNQALVLRAQIGYEAKLIDKYRVVDIDAALPAAEVLRTNTAMFVESPQDGAANYPHFPRDEMHGAFVVYPLLVAGEPSGVVALGFDEPREFGADERSFINAVVEACAQALQRALLYESERTSRARLRTLLEASERLAALDDPESQLAVVAEIAATRIGRWATVQTVESDGTLRRAAVAHANREMAQVLHELLDRRVDGGALSQRVVDTREPYVMPDPIAEVANLTGDADVRSLVEALGWRSGIVVPMTIAGRCIGVLAIGDDRALRLGAAEIELALDLGRRSASAYERARLLRAEQERSAIALRESEERLAAEHRLVEVLQRTILPEELPQLRGVEVAACYQPAETGVEVGGDWYDAFSDQHGGIVIVVGDVAGHGIEAATLMGRVRNSARAFAVEDSDPARILARLDYMLRTLDTDAFATAIAAHFDPVTREFTWARAGHPPPLLCAGGHAEYLERPGGTPLGSMMSSYVCASRTLDEGSLLLLYTDGLVERRAFPIDEGLAWLASRVRDDNEPDLDSLCSLLIKERFGDQPSDDDICVFALRTGDAHE